MKNQKTLTALALLIAATGTAHASLTNVGNGLIYDSNINITFTSDANLFKTLAPSINTIILDTPLVDGHTMSAADFSTTSVGKMDWWGAQAWIGYLNKTNYDGHSNWSLPTTNLIKNSIADTVGYFQTGSPLGELFYNELGGKKGENITVTNNANYNLFSNVASNSAFWTGKSNNTANIPSAWYFDYTNGSQGWIDKGHQFYVLPVFTTAVPLPSAVWLFGSGLMALLGFIKRRNIG